MRDFVPAAAAERDVAYARRLGASIADQLFW
jgi:hypothetical protein